MVKTKKDLTNLRFGSLVVVKQTEDHVYKDGSRKAKWLCICDCGNQKSVIGKNLLNGATRSCGCLQKQVASKLLKTHGKSNTVIYNVWRNIIGRCYNKNLKCYKYYGAKGVDVCDSWRRGSGKK